MSTNQHLVLELVAALEATIPRYQAALRQAVEQAEGPDRLTMPQLRCLQTVVAECGVALTTGLARALCVAVPTVTRMIDGLAERGLVERRADPDNRRQIRIAATEDGIAVMTRYEGIIRARLQALVAPLDLDQQQRLLQALDDLAGVIELSEMARR